jgi:hypothetical protein
MAETHLTRELTKEEIAEFKEAFDMFDIDHGGKITDTRTIACNFRIDGLKQRPCFWDIVSF